MRRGLLVFSVLLLSALWASAQNSAQTSKTSAGGQTTVEGCLSGSNGSYMLTDHNGTMYELSGDTAKLSEHVGHEIKVSGTESTGSAASAGEAAHGASEGAHKTIEVASVKHISKTCKSGSGMSH